MNKKSACLLSIAAVMSLILCPCIALGTLKGHASGCELELTSEAGLPVTLLTRQKLLAEFAASTKRRLEIDVALPKRSFEEEDERTLNVVVEKVKGEAIPKVYFSLRFKFDDDFESAVASARLLESLRDLELLPVFKVPKFEVIGSRNQIRFDYIEGVFLDQLITQRDLAAKAGVGLVVHNYLSGLKDLAR